MTVLGHSRSVTPDSDHVFLGRSGALVRPKFAVVNASSGTSDVVAAVTDKRIRVLGYETVLSSLVSVDVTWLSAATPITGPMQSLGRDRRSAAFSPIGLFETDFGEALRVTVGGSGNTLGGYLTYIEVEQK